MARPFDRIGAKAAGYTDQEIDSFVSQQEAGGSTEDTKDALDIQGKQLTIEIAKENLKNLRKPEEPTAEEKTQLLKRKNIQDSAQAVLDTIPLRDTMTAKEFETAIDFAVSDYNKRAFEEGGQALTKEEKPIIAGTQIKMLEKRPNVAERFGGWITGASPAVTMGTNENLETIRQKMILAINAVDPNAKLKYTPSPKGKESNGSDFMSGDIQAAKDILELTKAGYQKNPTAPWIGAAEIVGKGIVENPEEFFGAIGSDITQAVNDPKGTLWRNPVQSAALVAPLLKASKLAIAGKLGKSGKAVGLADIPTSGVPPTGGNIIQKTGTGMRSGVRDIDVGPSLFGPERQAQINKTMDTLGIKGSAKDQYTQLHSNVENIGNTIETELKNNPQIFITKNIIDDFKINLDEAIRTGNLTAKKVKQTITNYMSALYKGKMGNTISSDDLFKVKKAMNEDYKGVKKKLDAGTPLTDTEKVIAAGRQTIDDILSQEYPQIKQLTLMQHDLYDAIDSLYKQSKEGMKLRVPLTGNFIPLPTNLIRRTQDKFGSLLQGKQELPNIAPTTEAGRSATVKTASSGLNDIPQTPLKTESPFPQYPASVLENIPNAPSYIKYNLTGKLYSTKNMTPEKYQEILNYNKEHPTKFSQKTKSKG